MTTSPSTPVRRPRRMLRFVAALLAVATVAAGCYKSAEDFSDEELREELIEVLTESGITAEQANCVTDGLFEQAADRDQINRIANADDADDLSEADNDLLIDVIISCA